MCPAKRVPHLPKLGRFGRRRCLGAFASSGGIKGDRNFRRSPVGFKSKIQCPEPRMELTR